MAFWPLTSSFSVEHYFNDVVTRIGKKNQVVKILSIFVIFKTAKCKPPFFAIAIPRDFFFAEFSYDELAPLPISQVGNLNSSSQSRIFKNMFGLLKVR